MRVGSGRVVAAAMATLLVSQGLLDQPVAASSNGSPWTKPAAPAADPVATHERLVLDPADELPGRRTASTRTYDLGDGRHAVEAFSGRIFYQPDGSSDWQPIDLDFAPADSGATAAVTASPVKVRVGAQAAGLVVLEFEDHRIALRPIPVVPVDAVTSVDAVLGEAPALESDTRSLPTDAEPVALDQDEVDAALAAPVTAARPALDKQRVDLSDVLPGVGLRVFAHADGTSNFLVLAERPAQTGWTFAITSPGLNLEPGKDGALDFVDEGGVPVATMPAPYAVDSTPDEYTGSGRITTAAWYTLSTLGEQQLVTVSVDPEWLASAVYPVYVDPSVTVYNNGSSTYGDTHVNEGNPTFNWS